MWQITATYGPETPERAAMPYLTALGAAETNRTVQLTVKGPAVKLLDESTDLSEIGGGPYPTAEEVFSDLLDAEAFDDILLIGPSLEAHGVDEVDIRLPDDAYRIGGPVEYAEQAGENDSHFQF